MPDFAMCLNLLGYIRDFAESPFGLQVPRSPTWTTYLRSYTSKPRGVAVFASQLIIVVTWVKVTILIIKASCLP